MSLYFVFTIDGDWDEYFSSKLPLEQRKPDKKTILPLIDAEIDLAAKVVKGKFIHFVHTSPLVRDFFLRPELISCWKKIEKQGGEVGVHCHEEDLYQNWYFDDIPRMEKVITYLTEGLKAGGLTPLSYRGGYLTFSSKIIPILEKNKLFLDYTSEPGRHLIINNKLVSDWRGAPDNVYRLSYEDQRKPGISQVFEVPLGIYIERLSLWSIWQKARALKQKKGITLVSAMAHTYDFASARMRLKIKLALLILKTYGKFIGSKEALGIVKGGSD